MATKKDNIPIATVTKGMQSNYSHYVASSNSWSLLENFENDELGILTTRSNVVIIGTETVESTGVGTYLLAGNSSFLVKRGADLLRFFSDIPLIGTTLTGVFTNALSVARFSQVREGVFIASYSSNIKYYNGTTAVTILNSMGNINDLISAGFLGRIWASSSEWAGSDLVGRIYYSDVIPTTGPAFVTGGSNFLTISTGGRPLTGLIDANKVLYCFSNDGIWRVQNTQSQDNAPITSIGAIRQEVIVKAFDSIFYMHTTGIYELRGESSVKISQDIDNIFQKLNLSAKNNNFINNLICSSWSDNNAVYFSIGLAKQWGLQGFTDRSYVLRYNYNYKTWAVYSFKDVEIYDSLSIFTPFSFNQVTADFSPSTFIYAKNTKTNTFKSGFFNVPTKADGSKPLPGSGQTYVYAPKGDWGSSTALTTTSEIVPIFCNAETQWFTFGVENMQKEVNGISVASENGAGFNIMYQIDKDNTEKNDRDNAKWAQIGSLTDDYITFFRDFKSKKFYRIRFKVSGTTVGTPVKIGQIQMLSVTNYGYGVN
jgi:hypothetical protein